MAILVCEAVGPLSILDSPVGCRKLPLGLMAKLSSPIQLLPEAITYSPSS